MTDLTPDAVRAMLARADAASAGPWLQDGPQCLPWHVSPLAMSHAGRRIRVQPTAEDESEMDCIPDAVFIAAARTDLPLLAESWLALNAEIERLKLHDWRSKQTDKMLEGAVGIADSQEAKAKRLFAELSATSTGLDVERLRADHFVDLYEELKIERDDLLRRLEALEKKYNDAVMRPRGGQDPMA